MNEPLTRADICAVIVTYHPDPGFPERLFTLVRQVGAVVVVDNGSAEEEVRILHNAASHPAVSVILNNENLGIASALNIGIRHAVKKRYAWAILFDQDSRADDDLVESLIAMYASFPEQSALVAIGAHFRDAHLSTTKIKPDHKDPCEWHEVDWIITSGCLLQLSAHGKVGPFRDDFFIDCVDTEYGLRACAKGYRIIKSRRPLMTHAIGTPTQHRLFGKKKWTTNHSADRRYYCARNYTVLQREYGRYAFGWWAIKGFLACIKPYKRILLYEQFKLSKLFAVTQGWWDGVRGKMGPRKH